MLNLSDLVQSRVMQLDASQPGLASTASYKLTASQLNQAKASFNLFNPAAGLTSQDLAQGPNEQQEDYEKSGLQQLLLDKTENERKLDAKVKNLGESLERIKKSYGSTAPVPITLQHHAQPESYNKYSGIDNYSRELSAKRSSGS